MESDVSVKVTERDLHYAVYDTEIFTVKMSTFIKELDNGYMLYQFHIRHRELPVRLPKRTYTIKGLEKTIIELSEKSREEVKPTVYIKQIIDYTIPMYGNKRCVPYCKLRVTDGVTTKVVDLKDSDSSHGYRQYFTFNRKRYYVKSVGTLYSPAYEIDYDYVG